MSDALCVKKNKNRKTKCFTAHPVSDISHNDCDWNYVSRLTYREWHLLAGKRTVLQRTQTMESDAAPALSRCYIIWIYTCFIPFAHGSLCQSYASSLTIWTLCHNVYFTYCRAWISLINPFQCFQLYKNTQYSTTKNTSAHFPHWQIQNMVHFKSLKVQYAGFSYRLPANPFWPTINGSVCICPLPVFSYYFAVFRASVIVDSRLQVVSIFGLWLYEDKEVKTRRHVLND